MIDSAKKRGADGSDRQCAASGERLHRDVAVDRGHAGQAGQPGDITITAEQDGTVRVGGATNTLFHGTALIQKLSDH